MRSISIRARTVSPSSSIAASEYRRSVRSHECRSAGNDRSACSALCHRAMRSAAMRDHSSRAGYESRLAYPARDPPHHDRALPVFGRNRRVNGRRSSTATRSVRAHRPPYRRPSRASDLPLSCPPGRYASLFARKHPKVTSKFVRRTSQPVTFARLRSDWLSCPRGTPISLRSKSMKTINLSVAALALSSLASGAALAQSQPMGGKMGMKDMEKCYGVALSPERMTARLAPARRAPGLPRSIIRAMPGRWSRPAPAPRSRRPKVLAR